MPDGIEFEGFSDDVLEGLHKVDDAGTELEGQITALLTKPEEERTDEEKKLLEENAELIEKLRAGDGGKGGQEGGGKPGEDDLGAIEIFGKEEGFIAEGKYEDSVEGLKAYVKDRDAKRDLVVLGTFLKANPDLAAVYQHVVVEQKPLASLLKQADKPAILATEVKSLTGVADENKQAIIDSHVKIIREDLKGKLPEKLIESTIKAAVDSGDTEELAKQSLANIEKTHKEQIKAMEESAAAQREADKKAAESAMKAIKETISKGVLAANVIIPDADKQSFLEFLTVPIDATTGDTKYTQILENLTPDEEMFLDWLVYTKFKHGKLDINLLKYKSSTTPFIKGAKDENNSRGFKGKGSGTGSKFGAVSNIPASRFEM